MKIKITPKQNPNNVVNVRAAMSGKKYDDIVTKLSPGAIVEAKETRNGEWFKVDGGYVRADLAVIVEDETDDADDIDFNPPEVEVD